MLNDYSETEKIIQNYWANSAAGFSEFVNQEDLAPERKKLWLSKIINNAPDKVRLDILDVGTGPGFFAIILAEAGHRVTAIDCTQNMLDEAELNASAAGVEAAFMKMDSHELDFDNESFDLIVSRNVTWTLCDPVRAYKEWLRVLRPGGKFIVFDANYGMYCYDEEIARKKRESEAAYKKLYGIPVSRNGSDEEYFERMYLSNKLRPEWDEAALKDLGVSTYIERNVSSALYSEQRQLLNAASPLFMIVAEKPKI